MIPVTEIPDRIFTGFGKENGADRALSPGFELLSLQGGYTVLPRDTAQDR
jgi:hypothetical protein